MKIENNKTIKLSAEKYDLNFYKDRPYVGIRNKEGNLLMDLYLVSSCNTLEGRDVVSNISDWNYEESQGQITFTATADSSIWKSKEYKIVCKEDRFEYSFDINGKGSIDEVEYFSGYYTGSLRWSSGRFYSSFIVDKIFNPEPDCKEEFYSLPSETTGIDLTGVPIYGKDHWFFTPPPFSFVGIKDNVKFTIGVKAEERNWLFTEFIYKGGKGSYLSLSYEGHTKIEGEYSLPKIVFIFGEDEYELLKTYSDLNRVNRKSYEQPSWWKTPIFCGWGAQCALEVKTGEPASKLATEENYYGFLNKLREINLNPGIIVIDDKWQKNYGLNDVDKEKWPDMKNFIKDVHNNGKKVLLWLKAWDPEGVSEELCIRDFKGNKLAVDPTNPEYGKIFRACIKNILSKEGLDADGFKIDFTARIPSGAYCKSYGNLWGLELMKKYLEIIHTEAKKVKRDALIISHTPNPYLENVTDMIRLNDVNTSADINNAMLHRARVAKAACPSLVIDTDNWPMPNKKAWLDYIKLQPELGVPSLYYIDLIDNSKEEITEEEHKVIRKAWDAFERGEKYE
ncbi:Glycosyl hydrolases family 31 [Clostridium sp. USBA 49]|uniref:TIM-barrel domain-containing protein n=1 Tax=Clostridium sp. USBA 49 TaxID=1881060 RepID=UPI000999EBFB|nr:TIM-barrel domain-containing protein [Clostridium sp. USBA 49]SKA85351.1 Glycosyl hydrolases family 31 [Clostridium sp. USBA 49]